MSQGSRRSAVPRDITAFGRRVERWRQERVKRSAMPESLWQEAIRLARTHGVSPVCRHVGLGYTSLQKRVAGQEASLPATAKEGCFVELSAGQLLGASAAQTVLELSDRNGMRLTLRLAAGLEVDLEGLVHSFRGRGR